MCFVWSTHLVAYLRSTHNVMKVHFFGFNMLTKCTKQIGASTQTVSMRVFTSDLRNHFNSKWNKRTCRNALILNGIWLLMATKCHEFIIGFAFCFLQTCQMYEKRFYSVHWIAHLEYDVDTITTVAFFYTRFIRFFSFSILIQYNFMLANSLKTYCRNQYYAVLLCVLVSFLFA